MGHSKELGRQGKHADSGSLFGTVRPEDGHSLQTVEVGHGSIVEGSEGVNPLVARAGQSLFEPSQISLGPSGNIP
jgi:hypothetical protein